MGGESAPFGTSHLVRAEPEVVVLRGGTAAAVSRFFASKLS